MKISVKHPFFIVLLFVSVIYACNRPSEGSRIAGKHIKNAVAAKFETTPVPQNKNEDAADDPAVWIDSENPEKSVIIGTDKKGGLATYNLSGEQLNYYPAGKMNNCDLRYGFTLNGEKLDILAASNRSSHSISLFRVRENGVLDSIHARTIVSEMKDEVYGLCMYKSAVTGKFFVFMNSKDGEVEQWELFDNNGKADAILVRAFSVNTQTEGMVADDETGLFYLGKEVAGIWKFNAEPTGSDEGVFIANSSEENTNIKYDIEGLAIYDSGNGNGYLVASSQGNYSYAVFERQGSNKYLGSFRIADGEVDGVEETDGIEVVSTPLPGFPKGLFIAQDGYNYDGRKKRSQNFKLVSWEEIEVFFK
ncbi:3-phytase [Mariniphaga anaerophila]|uniref:3-phytase n=1 Tax=Mariniphaga anaerophila TaxID=1484053 RepID=A0A1M5BXS3_9BACT|nr:phytase [Mariniphaga anaerophila]SHF47180.1 3-phytase [Mariniphaga anaerophila]